VYASRTRKEKCSNHNVNCQKNESDLEGSLVTSSRTPGQLEKRPDDRTSNAGVVVWTADGSRRTAGSADEQCLKGVGATVRHVPRCLCCRHRWNRCTQLISLLHQLNVQQHSESCSRLASSWSYFRVSLTTRAAAFITDKRSAARHMLWASLSFCPSVCLLVTREPRVNGSRYWNMSCTVR